MKKTSSTKKIIFTLIVLGLGTGGYLFASKRKDAANRVSGIESEVVRAKTEIETLYKQRVELLESWEKATQKLDRAELPKSLRLSDTVRGAKDLKLESESDVIHFDFVQNQVSQTISEYLQSELAKKTKPKGLEKLEETINFQRRAYHVSAFEMEELQKQYRLKSPKPLIFPAERMLKERGLYH